MELKINFKYGKHIPLLCLNLWLYFIKPLMLESCILLFYALSVESLHCVFSGSPWLPVMGYMCYCVEHAYLPLSLFGSCGKIQWLSPLHSTGLESRNCRRVWCQLKYVSVFVDRALWKRFRVTNLWVEKWLLCILVDLGFSVEHWITVQGKFSLVFSLLYVHS